VKPGCARLDGGRADRREVDIEAQRQHRRCGPTQTHLLHGLEAAAIQQCVWLSLAVRRCPMLVVARVSPMLVCSMPNGECR